MKLADKILIVILMAASALLVVPILFNAPEASTAVVSVKNEEVLRLSLLEDGEYEVEGTLGNVHISVKDGAVAVTQENSPNHYCSLQGYVSDGNIPIVCLPNETVVRIQGSDSGEDTVIQ
jgi:hypothetical protein